MGLPGLWPSLSLARQIVSKERNTSPSDRQCKAPEGNKGGKRVWESRRPLSGGCRN